MFSNINEFIVFALLCDVMCLLFNYYKFCVQCCLLVLCNCKKYWTNRNIHLPVVHDLQSGTVTVI